MPKYINESVSTCNYVNSLSLSLSIYIYTVYNLSYIIIIYYVIFILIFLANLDGMLLD